MNELTLLLAHTMRKHGRGGYTAISEDLKDGKQPDTRSALFPGAMMFLLADLFLLCERYPSIWLAKWITAFAFLGVLVAMVVVLKRAIFGPSKKRIKLPFS
jgi:hypothetical protein